MTGVQAGKKITTAFLMAGAMVMMGIALPSCPGQQAMQKQIDEMQAKEVQLQGQLNGANDKVKALETEVKDLKTLLDKTADVLKTHFDSISELQRKVEELAKVPPPKAAPAARAPVKKRR